MISFLSKKETIANLDKVRYLLFNYVGKPYKPLDAMLKVLKPEPIQSAIPVNFVKKVEIPLTDGKVAPQLQTLIQLKKNHYNKRNELSQEIQDLTHGQVVIPIQVQDLVKEVLSIDDEIKAIDSKIEYWNKYQELPQSKKELEKPSEGFSINSEADRKEAVDAIKKQIKNQLTYVAKAKQKFERSPENMRLAEDLEKKKLELKRLHFEKDSLSAIEF